MNCQEFLDHLPQRGHDISEAQAAHLADCAACSAYRALAAGLRSMGEEWRKVEAPARVEAGLMAAFRVQVGAQGRNGVSRTWWTPVFAWASAAAATVALAIVLVRGYQPGPAKPSTVAAPHRAAQPIVQVAMTEADSDDDSTVFGDGFVRLPNAPRSEPNEDFNVVRVEVPGSAMIEAGISLGEDRAKETVLADVALASDGTPRAVRLVADGGSY